MSTLVERLEAEAARTEFVETRDPVVLQGSRPKYPEPLRDLLREAAAALRATTGEEPNIGVGVDVTAEGAHVTVAHRVGPVDRIIYSEFHAAPPAPLRDAPTNPGEISSKVVEPLRDALKESEVIEASEFALANPDSETSTPLELGVVTSKPGGGFKVTFAPLRDAGAVPYAWVVEFNDPDPQTDIEFGLERPGGWPDAFPLYTHPAPQQPAITDAAALETFTEYFVRNYPGPNTIIGDPHWHAPRIFRAAKRALAAAAKEVDRG